MFETTRSEAGELLYQLKYGRDPTAAEGLIEAAVQLLQRAGTLHAVVTVPPSRKRAVQPVHVLGDGIAQRLGIPFRPGLVSRTKSLPELKSIYDYDNRINLLADAHRIAPGVVKGLRLLLFDDLYRSGASMNAVADLLYSQGEAADVIALTITRTRSNQ